MRILRRVFHALGAVLSLGMASVAISLGAALLGLWLWVQSEGSLGQALWLVQPWLPSGYSLEFSQVQGSVQRGGRIGELHWRQPGLELQARGLALTWSWQRLLQQVLPLSDLHVQSMQVRQPPRSGGSTLSELPLPLRADVHIAVDQLHWDGPPELALEHLRGQYRYDGNTHVVQDFAARMAAGNYQGQASLQARRPMALALQLQGTVQTPWHIRQQALQLWASASAQGRLLGPDAALEVQAALLPQGQGKSQPLGAMQATLQARIVPGAAQPLASAQARWSALDLASLWPQAPHTRLDGNAQVQPDGEGWRAALTLENALAGPLDAQRLPVGSAQGALLYRAGQWQLSQLRADLAGGVLQAQGRYGDGPARWSVQATVQDVRPALLDSRLQLPSVQGQLTAQQLQDGLVFDANLAGAHSANSAAVQLQARGRWLEPLLVVEQLHLHSAQFSLDGQLQFDTHSQASSLRLQGSAPGARLELDGSLAETSGQGSASLRVEDAQALLPWLATLPGLNGPMAGLQAQGALQASLRWSGGWQQQDQGLQLQGALDSARLELQGQQLRNLQLRLDGSPAELVLQLSGTGQAGATTVALQARARGGRSTAAVWRARLEQLQLQARNALYTAPWQAQLEQPVQLEWQPQGPAPSFAMDAGALRLSGPAPGVAQLQWQPVQWSRQGSADEGAAQRWNTRGALQGLPLAWIELLGQARLANLGLRGDLLLEGQWDASAGDALRLHASLQRSSGDLLLLASDPADPAGAALAAGLKQARLSLDIEGQELRASLLWASEAGGNADAQFSTRLQTAGGRIRWPDQAPLQGRLHASLPRVGAWSLVAPVGWRMQGTLQADATLSGTRNRPAWVGEVTARDMSVRSVVDGIDFSQGLMRLRVDGQRLEVQELVLQGAGGASGGLLRLQGFAQWDGAAPAPGAAASQRLRMELQGRAEHFRLSAKADTRLVVSGDLQARLSNARLSVRGALVADQALIVLPEDSAPRLGTDVVVQRPQASAKPKPAGVAQANQWAQTVQPDVSVTLDPGSNFLLQGHGINTRLAGMLTLKAEGAAAKPRLNGELHTVAGTYRAYGQNLNIEEGTLRFAGVYDNPALDIRAVRPNLSQEVGVQISGTAQLPVVRLYSDPDMPDADKLSWLVLGHAASNGGAETAMLQQAALALLAGKGPSPTSKLVTAFGLDEVSLGQAATTNLDGRSGTETTVKLGKRISRDFYVAYERGLSSTLGTFYVFYDLSRRFTLRAESGVQNAVDLIFTTRFD